MTFGHPDVGLRIDADLRVDVDGVHAQVVGQGDELEVRTDDPGALWRAAMRAAPAGRHRTLRAVRGIASTLAESGVTVVVPWTVGTSVRVGAAARPGLVGRSTVGPHIEVVVPSAARRALTSLGLLVVVVVTARRHYRARSFATVPR